MVKILLPNYFPYIFLNNQNNQIICFANILAFDTAYRKTVILTAAARILTRTIKTLKPCKRTIPLRRTPTVTDRTLVIEMTIYAVVT